MAFDGIMGKQATDSLGPVAQMLAWPPALQRLLVPLEAAQLLEVTLHLHGLVAMAIARLALSQFGNTGSVATVILAWCCYFRARLEPFNGFLARDRPLVLRNRLNLLRYSVLPHSLPHRVQPLHGAARRGWSFPVRPLILLHLIP